MIPIPGHISKQLSDHILSECPNAQGGWEFGNQDEDTLTGHFFGRMTKNWQTLDDYKWRFHYNKVRGRGKGAMEKKIGADGIITLHYQDNTTGINYYKSLVFQAKKENNKIDFAQWSKMNQFFPNGNIIVSYGPNGFNCFIGDKDNKHKLCQALATDFINCKIGIEGLYYEHSVNKFVRPKNIPISGTIENELMIEVFKNP